MQRYVILLRDKVQRDGGEAASTKVLLSNNDAQCFGCGYNLRGAQSGECPECGQQIELKDVPRQILLFPDPESRAAAD